jgi:hypothetical protein
MRRSAGTFGREVESGVPVIRMLPDIIIFVVIFFTGIAFSVFYSVRRMLDSPGIQAAPEIAPSICEAVPPQVAGFLQSQGFEFSGSYRFHSVKIGVWEQRGGPRSREFWFTRTIAGTSYEFSTEFSDEVSLTTTKSGAAFVFPRPFGSFMQSFPSASITELWDAHVRGGEYLISDCSIRTGPSRLSREERQRRGAIEQLNYIRSLPLWPLRGIYWYLIKRFLMHNRPIWKQDVAKIYPRVSKEA